MGKNKDKFITVIGKKSLPKILIRAFVWLLSLFVIGGAIDYFVNKDLKAEAERMEEVNRIQRDSLVVLMDSIGFQSTIIGIISFELDSLRERTGPIRWRTIYQDTGSTVIDSFPYLVIDSVPVPIPVAVAKELNSCRELLPECKKLKVQVDSLIAYVPTVIDSMQREIDIKDQIINPTWNLGLFHLPKPKDYCGITAGYNLIPRSVSSTSWSNNNNDYYTPETSSSDISRWNITLGCGIGIRMGIL